MEGRKIADFNCEKVKTCMYGRQFVGQPTVRLKKRGTEKGVKSKRCD